jgi:hypothetical protein
MAERADNSQQRAKAAKEADTSQASLNQHDDDTNPGITNVQPTVDEEVSARHHEEEVSAKSHSDPTAPVKNDHALRQLEELRSERDPGYGSEYIGDEYKDVKVEDDEKGEVA